VLVTLSTTHAPATDLGRRPAALVLRQEQDGMVFAIVFGGLIEAHPGHSRLEHSRQPWTRQPWHTHPAGDAEPEQADDRAPSQRHRPAMSRRLRSAPECHEDGGLPRITLAVRARMRVGRRPGPHVARWIGPEQDSAAVTTASPHAGGLSSLAFRLGELGQPVTAVIESMNGARFHP
jgi:hypothetical protein